MVQIALHRVAAIWRIIRQNKQYFTNRTKLKEPLKFVFKIPQQHSSVKDKRVERIRVGFS